MVGFDTNWSTPDTMRPEDIPTLVEAAKADPALFGKLYSHYVQPVYRYLLSHLGTIPEAQDLTSQTFISAYEALPRYRERGYFSAWLFRIARSKINDHYRQSRREVRLDAAEEVTHNQDSLAQVIHDEDISRLQSLIKQLRDEEQDLIRLRYVADLSFAEMADLLGKREDAVKKSFYRLLARLKDQME